LKHATAHDLLDHHSMIGRHLMKRDGFKTESEMVCLFVCLFFIIYLLLFFLICFGKIEFNKRVSIAPIHYAPGVNFWKVDGKERLAANHAKVYIVDDKQFFVGSDNFYVAGSLHGLQVLQFFFFFLFNLHSFIGVWVSN
jgi:hypothetical protein